MRIDVVTIFPEYLQPLQLSIIGKACRTGIVDLRVRDLRDHTHDRHRTVDSPPYGGGAGMVMRPEPWGEALHSVLGDDPVPGVRAEGPVLVVPSPAGERFTQSVAAELAAEPWLMFACGRYEGIDERVMEHAATMTRVRPISLGDYVLNGGEVAVLAIVEAVARLLPGVVGNTESLVEESHAAGLLEAPAYTKPPLWQGAGVPEVLISGHHAMVGRWRRDQSLRRTADRRPDLIAALPVQGCDAADLAVLADLGWVPRPGGDGFTPRPPTVADSTTVPTTGSTLPRGSRPVGTL